MSPNKTVPAIDDNGFKLFERFVTLCLHLCVPGMGPYIYIQLYIMIYTCKCKLKYTK